MRWIDLPTLILIITAALVLGILGLVRINLVEYFLGEHAKLGYLIFGLAGIWQLSRQRFF